MSRILIVDDLAKVRGQIASALQHLDAELLEAQDGVQALEIVERSPVDVVLTDVRMPRMGGLDLLRSLREKKIPAILHSGYADVEAAMAAVRLGAIDFFPAPIELDRLCARVEHCLHRGGEVAGILAGESAQVQEIHKLIERFAGESAPVLITGETGAGKEVVARAIHAASNRKTEPFEVLQVGGLISEDESFWSELSGGQGVGTILLDEICDAPDAVQAAIARMIDRLGGPSPRLIVTTRKDIMQEMAARRFRDDLWFRLSALRIHVAPLRERPEDIAPIARLELENLSKEKGGIPFEIDDDGCAELAGEEWKGNVRELQITMRRMAILAGERRLLDRYDVREALRLVRLEAKPRAQYEEKERAELVALLDANGWNVSATARKLGKDRGWLRRRMARFGLD